MVAKLLVSACGAVALAAIYMLGSPTAVGQTPTPIAIDADGDREVSVRLAQVLATEVRALSGFEITDPRRARYSLKATLVELDRVERGPTHEVDCQVNVLITDADGSTVRAMLSGRAGVRGNGHASRVEQAAIAAAIRGALRPLARTLPRLR